MRHLVIPIGYTGSMHPGGRPTQKARPAIGERIAQARQRVDISQRELAERMGITQQSVAALERRTSVPRSDTLQKLSAILNVSANELLGIEEPKPTRAPAGSKLSQVFEQVAKLPRRQQTKIVEVVEALLAKAS
jgi:transcriptional regulator with XRE-family HTH domain